MSDSGFRQTTPVTEENTRTSRFVQLPSCVSSGPASTVVVFSYGLLLGAAGGQLLGRVVMVLLQSLELLAGNKQLMDHLNSYIKTFKDRDLATAGRLGVPQIADSENMFNSFISILTEEFCYFSISVSLAVGVPVGVWMYQIVIKRHGDTARGKALALAGPLCLMGVTATGYIPGLFLEDFLPMPAFFTECFIIFTIVLFLSFEGCKDVCPLVFLYVIMMNAPLCFMLPFALIAQTKLLLMVGLIPKIVFFLSEPMYFELRITPVPLMLVVTDVFNFARQPIVSLQLPTNTSNAAVEGIFVGVFASQMLMMSIGMSLFVSWHKAGAGKICAGAAVSGTAVVLAIRDFLPVLGPGPTIGALMGVAGAAGASLAAAGAATDQYEQFVPWSGFFGRLGAAVGSGLVAFLYSRTCSGLSGIFIGVCAATVPAEACCKSLFLFIQKHITGWKFKIVLGIAITSFISTWVYFTCSNLAVILGIALIGTLVVWTPVAGLVLGCLLLWLRVRGPNITPPEQRQRPTVL